LRISRIKLKFHFVYTVETDPGEIGYAFHRASILRGGAEIGAKGVY
jgi:hypothetical protein